MKRLLAILLAAAAALSAAGCRNQVSQGSADNPTVPATADSATADSATRDELRHKQHVAPYGDLSATHPYDYPISSTYFSSRALKNRSYQLDTEELLQNPELPDRKSVV